MITIYRAWHPNLTDGMGGNQDIGYFTSREEAQKVIDAGDYYVQGVRHNPDGTKVRSAAEITPIQIWQTADAWFKAEAKAVRDYALSKLTAAERKALGL